MFLWIPQMLYSASTRLTAQRDDYKKGRLVLGINLLKTIIIFYFTWKVVNLISVVRSIGWTQNIHIAMHYILPCVDF